LLVAILIGNGANVTSANYAGSALTLIDTALSAGGYRVHLYKKLSPATGTNTISFTFSAVTFRLGQSASYTGASDVDVSTKLESQTNTPVTLNLTTLEDDSWTFLTGLNYTDNFGTGTSTVTAGTGSTLRKSNTTSGDNMALGIFDSNGPIASPSNTSMSIGVTPAGPNVQGTGAIMVSITPFIAGAGGDNFQMGANF
jgi:hypothetical protein